MYHIKPDRRSRNSADELARGLNLCLKTMPLSAVTVTDLHRVTGVSRATFYRLFDNVEDILIYQCDQLLESIRDNPEEWENLTPREAMRNILLMGFEHVDFLESMVSNRRFDLLYEYTARRIFSVESLRQVFAEGLNEAETEYMTGNLAMSLVAILTTWIRRGRVETAEEIFDNNLRYWETMSRIMTEKTKKALPLSREGEPQTPSEG